MFKIILKLLTNHERVCNLKSILTEEMFKIILKLLTNHERVCNLKSILIDWYSFQKLNKTH